MCSWQKTIKQKGLGIKVKIVKILCLTSFLSNFTLVVWIDCLRKIYQIRSQSKFHNFKNDKLGKVQGHQSFSRSATASTRLQMGPQKHSFQFCKEHFTKMPLNILGTGRTKNKFDFQNMEVTNTSRLENWYPENFPKV